MGCGASAENKPNEAKPDAPKPNEGASSSADTKAAGGGYANAADAPKAPAAEVAAPAAPKEAPALAETAKTEAAPKAPPEDATPPAEAAKPPEPPQAAAPAEAAKVEADPPKAPPAEAAAPPVEAAAPPMEAAPPVEAAPAEALQDCVQAEAAEAARQETEAGIALRGSFVGSTGEVFIKILKAEGLVNRDLVGKSDAYCVLRALGENGFAEIWRTKVINNDLNPVWNEELRFKVDTDHLEIAVFDSDSLKKDDPLGTIPLDLSKLTKLVRHEEVRDISTRDAEGNVVCDSAKGKLHFLIELAPKNVLDASAEVIAGLEELFADEDEAEPPSKDADAPPADAAALGAVPADAAVPPPAPVPTPEAAPAAPT